MLDSMMTTMRSSSHPLRPMKSRFLSAAGFARASDVMFKKTFAVGFLSTLLIALCHGQVLTFQAHYDGSKDAEFAYGNPAEGGSGALGAIVTDGKFGGAAQFGENTWYTYDTADNISPTEGTILFWAKKDTSGGSWQCLFSMGTSDFWTPTTKILFRTEGWCHGYLTVSDAGGVHVYNLMSTINSAAEWNHFAMTWSTHDTNKIDLAFYANGQLAGSLTDQNWNGFVFDNFFAVGGYQPYWAPNADGKIDDLGIVNTALSGKAIFNHYSSGVALPDIGNMSYTPGGGSAADEKAVLETGTVLANRFKSMLVKPGWAGYYGKSFSNTSTGSNWYQSSFNIDGGYGTVTDRTTQPSSNQLDTTVTLNLSETISLEAAVVSIYIPISAGQQGGQFRIGNNEWAKFPDASQPGTISSAVGNVFAWCGAGGKGAQITFPSSTYIQLQDNRQWGQCCFELLIWIPLAYPNVPAGTYTLTYTTKPIPCMTEAPFVDPYGQTNYKLWNGKVTADSDLTGDVSKENRDLPLLVPPNRDNYGGWAGTQQQYNLAATGFFRTQKVNGRWWLVDPDGNLFFFAAAEFGDYDTFTVTTNQGNLFEWLPAVPPNAGQWTNAWMGSWFSFYVANQIKKYGSTDRVSQYISMKKKRCYAWGFNASGAWSGDIGDITTPPIRYIGYTSFLSPLGDLVAPVTTMKSIPGATPDIFDPAFLPALSNYFSTRLPAIANDPHLIGYYIGNEEHFEGILSACTLDGTYYTKQDLVNNFLKPRYNNTIALFNSAWSMNASSFDALINLSFSATTDAAGQDMYAYLWRYVEYYLANVREKIRQYDQNHLTLGCRLIPQTASNPTIASCMGAYMDVFSVNYYCDRLSPSTLDSYYANTGDKPMILSEWSFGCADRGHAGGVYNVSNQRDRGYYYRDYVENAAGRANVLGCEWFAYTDQAITGRPGGGENGERFQTGLVDVTDRPYDNGFIDKVIQTNYRIYDVHSGSITPFTIETGHGEYALTINVIGNGTSNPVRGDHSYAPNEVVNLTAYPDSGYRVKSWSGTNNDPNTGGTTNTVNMNSDNKTVTVEFEPAWNLTINVIGNGASNPVRGDHSYAPNEVVNLTAYPESGYRVKSWSGTNNDPNTGGTTNTVNMNSDNKTVTVEFELAWNTTDINASGGSVGCSNGVFTVVGKGAGITGTADGFRFVYKAISGDCTITARISNLTGTTYTNGRSGVMIRQDTTSGAREASSLYKPYSTKQYYFQRRTATGGSTATSYTSANTITPWWVRMVRTGNTLKAYKSTNGTTWTQVGSNTTVTMTNPVQVGLVVASGNTSNANTATIDNVTVTQP